MAIMDRSGIIAIASLIYLDIGPPLVSEALLKLFFAGLTYEMPLIIC